MLTVPQSARLYRKHPETIRRWIREGKLPATRIGTQHMIDEDDLADFAGPPPVGASEAATVGATADVAALIRRPRAERPARIAESVAPYVSGLAAPPYPPERGDDWLPAIVGRIVRLVDPVRIVLFGSRARGDFRDDSDYDILVVVDEAPNRRETRIAIHHALAELPIAKDIVLATSKEVAWAPQMLGDILRAAVLGGRSIYERPEPR